MTDRNVPMGEGAVLVDSTVVLHALGASEQHRDRARAFLLGVWSAAGRAYASTEMVQEVVFHRMRKAHRDQAVAEAREITRSFIILDFDHEVLETALSLIEATRVRGRDAVHAATALAYGIENDCLLRPRVRRHPRNPATRSARILTHARAGGESSAMDARIRPACS